MLSISIVSMGAPDNLLTCVDSIQNNIGFSEYEILINAFNYSEENQQRLLSIYQNNNIPQVHIQFTSGVRGYTANHNLNIKYAKYPVICILNDDTYVTGDIFSTIVLIMADTTIAVCTPVIRNFDGSIQYLFRKKVSPFSYFLQLLKIGRYLPFLDVYERNNKIIENKETIEIPFGLGVCFFVKKNVLERGMLNDTFFLGPDDLYWSYLIRQRSSCNKIVLSCSTSIYHKGHATISRYFPYSIPAQIKGMMQLLEEMKFRGKWFYEKLFYVTIFGHFLVNASLYYLFGSERALLVKEGYFNTLKIFWKKSSTAAIFRFFYSTKRKYR